MTTLYGVNKETLEAYMKKEREKVVKQLVKQAKLICFLVETGHKWDGYALDYKEALQVRDEETP